MQGTLFVGSAVIVSIIVWSQVPNIERFRVSVMEIYDHGGFRAVGKAMTDLVRRKKNSPER